jgi:mannose-1-phosphate guanylyltransferase
MNSNNYVVIMAGGVGTRFWPYSRVTNPKQFQDMLGIGQSLIQITIERFKHICPDENIYIVTNADYYSLVKKQLPQLADEQILLEPVMRNTAPCVAYASYKIQKKNPNANIVVAPADQIIHKLDAFSEALLTAIEAAEREEVLLTLGIQPTRPDTGYGYIKMADIDSPSKVKKVKTFTEKPNLELALEFLESGDYVWNAGIFIFNVNTIIAAFKRYLPELHGIFHELKEDFYSPKEENSIKKAYSQCHNISIDYGIMEKADNVYVVPCDLGWSDLGTWKSLYEQSPKNKDGNVLSGNIMTYETSKSIIKMPEEKLVVVQGLDNYIVAEYQNVLLICQKDQEQRIKQFLDDAIKQKGTQFS